MYKITFYVPSDAAEAVKQAMFAAGAGRIGGYDYCSWQCAGQGQFRPLTGSNPTIGSHGDLTRLEELQVEMICTDACVAAAIAALCAAHPYETPAFAYWRVNDTLPGAPSTTPVSPPPRGASQ
ncbi:MAG: NGG1p interacting factor NIF3 [Lentisphaeria bacterium]|nr:NGG1p interacting factor NIF3 [Lentisphaeria bacterium]